MRLLRPADLPEIAALCAVAIDEPPHEPELRDALFHPDLPATVIGDPAVGLVACVERFGQAFIRLIAVHPAHRRRGVGGALLRAAEEHLGPGRAITAGSDAPDYLYPGVDSAQTELAVLFESNGYERVDARINMAVDLDDDGLRAAITGAAGDGRVRPAEDTDREALVTWLRANYPPWQQEALRALEMGTLLLSCDERGVAGFSAWGTHRRHWLGPIGVRRDGGSRGIGAPLLLAALGCMRDEGLARAEIAWVGPVGFYAKVAGARIARTFLVFKKEPVA